MKINHLALAICCMAFTSCNMQQKPESADITILCTTDVHGACLQYDFKLDRPAKTSLANVASYVRELRTERGEQDCKDEDKSIILLDTGDFLQGQPSIYYYNFVDTTSQHVASRVYNFIGYDALGVGNHDIETGASVYENRIPHELKMPWLCANAIDTRTGEPMFTPYIVLMRKGVKIAILGMITPHIHAWLPKSLWPNLEFEDMVECAKKWVPIINEKEKPDVLIGLFHSGGDYEYGGTTIDTPFNENGGVPVAMKVPGFDLVILGHDHISRNIKVTNCDGKIVKIIDPSTQARQIGRADIHLTLQSDGTYLKDITTSLIESEKYEPDQAFCTKFIKDIETVNKYVDSPIGRLTEDLEGINGLYGPCPFMDLIHDAQLWATNADVSFAAVLSPYDEIPAGEITMRHLFTIYKYENQLFKLRMTGAEIKKYLEFGFGNQFATMKTAKDPLIKRTEDGKPATQSFNYTSAAGIKYTVDISQPEGERVTIHSMSDGSPFDLNKDYSVAVNSYQASGGGDFIPVGLGWDEKTLKANTIDTTPIDVRRYVASYIQEKRTITPHIRGDWEIVPKDLWEAGKAREIANANNRNFR